MDASTARSAPTWTCARSLRASWRSVSVRVRLCCGSCRARTVDSGASDGDGERSASVCEAYQNDRQNITALNIEKGTNSTAVTHRHFERFSSFSHCIGQCKYFRHLTTIRACDVDSSYYKHELSFRGFDRSSVSILFRFCHTWRFMRVVT